MFEVFYNVKHYEKSSNLYGLLIERKAKFDSLQDAIKFVRSIKGMKKNGIEVIGMPAIERA